MATEILLAGLLVVTVGAYFAGRWWTIHGRSVAQLAGGVETAIDPVDATRVGIPFSDSRPRRWLGLAGYRSRTAPASFATAIAASSAAGLLAGFLVSPQAVTVWFSEGLVNIPGAFGDVLAVVAALAPWLTFLICASAPFVVVRAARRRRVRQAEQDMPLLLELLATLAEAGLGFDAALARILESQSGNRALAAEWRIFQRELLAGIPRLQCLRRVARRLEVMSTTVFVSALVQAEQVGASLTETLRTQADDLRDRRRQRVLMLSQALPAKLVFPLILCFLPGIFVSILGPAAYQLIQVADTVLR
jgi:tight adherence protein C